MPEADAAKVTVLIPQADWRRASPGRRCRAGAGGGGPGCGAPATMELNRGQYRGGRRLDVWWGYCDEHAFRRVLLDDGIYWADDGIYWTAEWEADDAE